MSIVVAVPIQYATVKVYVDKGRHWSVVEHVLLEAICRQPRSARELAAAADLPLRLVIEALINLMRAGWAELRPEADHMVFAATTGGAANAGLETLPPVTRPLWRNTKFAIDQVTGSVLRWREIAFIPHNSPRLNEPGLVRLPVSADLPPRSPIDIISTLLEDDERYRGADASSARPGTGFALVTVTGRKLEGLPRKPAPALEARIRSAARNVNDRLPLDASGNGTPDADDAEFRMDAHRISLSASDLVLGGEAHRALRDELIDRARSLIVIHSTFWSADALDQLFPALVAAARERGVQVHLFFGKDARPGENNPTAAARAHIAERIRAERLGMLIHAHPYSTKSHAKLIIADDGEDGFVGVVGSCNWLSTTFNLFEVSLRVSDPRLVADLAHALSQMAFEATGRDDGVNLDLAGVSLFLRAQPRGNGRTSAQLLLGPEHARAIELARDGAERRIVIGSHRMGANAETFSLIPTRAAVRENEIRATAYYSKDDTGGADAPPGSVERDIMMIEVADMHAKFLVWDDDDLVVTSHNLLSADPLAPWSEIGLHVRAPGIGRRVMDGIEALSRG